VARFLVFVAVHSLAARDRVVCPSGVVLVRRLAIADLLALLAAADVFSRLLAAVQPAGAGVLADLPFPREGFAFIPAETEDGLA
jgi:hypothetical protein